MKIVFVGDIFCGGDLLKEKPSPDLIQSPEFYKADFRIANLEGPLSDGDFVADKSTIYAPTRAVEYLKAFKLDGVSLANNHIQDKGEAGILDTMNTLEAAAIPYFGAGADSGLSGKPLILQKEGEKAAVLGYCDFQRPYMSQISLAAENKPGVSPLRYETIIEDLEKLPDDINRVILYFHWGREHTWFPPWNDIELAKKLLEHPRIDLVVGCHSHLPQGYIRHKGKKAYMGLGNFLFPNVFIKPPCRIDYPENAADYDIAHSYHTVYKLTHKRWPKWCRRALMITYDTNKGTDTVDFTGQEYMRPVVKQVNGFKRFGILTRLYNNSGIFYRYLSDAWYLHVLINRRIQRKITFMKHNGLLGITRK